MFIYNSLRLALTLLSPRRVAKNKGTVYEIWVLTTFGIYKIREYNSEKIKELECNAWYRFENLSWDSPDYVMDVNSRFTPASEDEIPKDISSAFTPMNELKPDLQNVTIFGIILKSNISSGTNAEGIEVSILFFIQLYIFLL